MSVSYVEPPQADERTKGFYNAAEERFEMLLNIFKVFGHAPELGEAFTQSVMAMLKDGELDWLTKELIILKATHRNACQYCVVQHETLSKRLGISEEKIADIGGDRYKDSPHFTDAEKTLMD
ncbi:MAG: carboxymuconolactone decarboxylase family protein, partial [Gammaproteobacteria bacterium]|nr:carboxymuconolactone decarboxylase family protein [Gammaproteobacteria bacterium]